MNGDIARVHPLKRLAYAFVALLAGDAVLFVVMLQFAIRERADLLAAHMGEPARIIPLTLQWFAINAGFSLAGWALIAVPVVPVPDRSIARLSWLSAIAVGASRSDCLVPGLRVAGSSTLQFFRNLPRPRLGLDFFRVGIDGVFCGVRSPPAQRTRKMSGRTP